MAQVIADQQAQLAEERTRLQRLADQIVTEVEGNPTVRHHVHGISGITATEQPLTGVDPARPANFREQRVLVGIQR